MSKFTLETLQKRQSKRISYKIKTGTPNVCQFLFSRLFKNMENPVDD